jgi:hypothetical protein
MDLSNINLEKNAEQGADMELVHPVTGDVMIQDNGKPITIKVLGTDSKAYRNGQREYQRKRIAKMAKSRNKSVDYTVSDEDAAILLAECTAGWDGIIVDGKKLEFSKDAAEELYLKFNWIREQVDGFIGDRANFFQS